MQGESGKKEKSIDYSTEPIRAEGTFNIWYENPEYQFATARMVADSIYIYALKDGKQGDQILRIDFSDSTKTEPIFIFTTSNKDRVIKMLHSVGEQAPYYDFISKRFGLESPKIEEIEIEPELAAEVQSKFIEVLNSGKVLVVPKTVITALHEGVEFTGYRPRKYHKGKLIIDRDLSYNLAFGQMLSLGYEISEAQRLANQLTDPSNIIIATEIVEERTEEKMRLAMHEKIHILFENMRFGDSEELSSLADYILNTVYRIEDALKKNIMQVLRLSKYSYQEFGEEFWTYVLTYNTFPHSPAKSNSITKLFEDADNDPIVTRILEAMPFLLNRDLIEENLDRLFTESIVVRPQLDK